MNNLMSMTGIADLKRLIVSTLSLMLTRHRHLGLIVLLDSNIKLPRRQLMRLNPSMKSSSTLSIVKKPRSTKTRRSMQSTLLTFLSDSIRRQVSSVIMRWLNRAFTLAKADCVAFAAADATQKYRVAVAEELASFAVWQRDIFFSCPAELEK